MHSGGKAGGAPVGNAYAMKHGLRSRRVTALRREMRELVAAMMGAVRPEAEKKTPKAKVAALPSPAPATKIETPRLNRRQRRALKAKRRK
jgi:hypothetical protein